MNQLASRAMAAILTAASLTGAAGAASAQALATAEASAARDIPGLSRQIVDDACREGSVMLYTLVFRGELEALTDAFQKRFPCITVQTFAASGGVLAQRFVSETQGGGSVDDVWMNSSPLFGDDYANKKYLLDWTPPGAANIPEDWKREGAWYAVGLAHIGVAWNTQGVTPDQKAWLENLKSWDQLPAAPFAGNTGMVDIRAGGTTQLPYYFFDKQYGPDFWNKLAALKPTVFNAINPLAERLAAGEFAFGPVVTADTAVATQWLNGAPLQWTFPEPGLAVPYFIGISSHAPHPNAAKLLMAWSVTRDGQSAWVNATGLAPASQGVDDQRRYAKEPWYKLPKRYYRPDWSAISAALGAQTAKFSSVFGR